MPASLSDLSKEAKQYWTNEEWGRYRNVRFEAAERVRRQGDRKRATFLYVEVMIFDLQGVAGGFAEDEFKETHRGETPSVAREVARATLREGFDEDDLKAIYDKVVDEFWVDAFPRSQDEVWKAMKQIVEDYRQTVQLKRRVENLGADRLLPASEATSYADISDDYELLQRVGTLLEDEPPAGISWEKRKRAHEYLSMIDIDCIGNRWKSKAYRWAGEVVLSNDEKESALQYFEKALEVADRDDQVLLKRLVETLRQELDQ